VQETRTFLHKPWVEGGTTSYTPKQPSGHDQYQLCSVCASVDVESVLLQDIETDSIVHLPAVRVARHVREAAAKGCELCAITAAAFSHFVEVDDDAYIVPHVAPIAIAATHDGKRPLISGRQTQVRDTWITLTRGLDGFSVAGSTTQDANLIVSRPIIKL